jgi:hypothetical protein
LRTAFFAAANSISSDNSRSRVLLALLRRKEPLDRASQVALLRSAREISSDHDKAAVLTAFAAEGAIDGDDAVRGAFFGATNTIASDSERSRLLQAVVRRAPLTAPTTKEVLTSTSGMASDHEKGTVLTAIARSTPLTDPTLRAQFISVLKTLSSDSEYRQVMDVLMK